MKCRNDCFFSHVIRAINLVFTVQCRTFSSTGLICIHLEKILKNKMPKGQFSYKKSLPIFKIHWSMTFSKITRQSNVVLYGLLLLHKFWEDNLTYLVLIFNLVTNVLDPFTLTKSSTLNILKICGSFSRHLILKLGRDTETLKDKDQVT